MEHLGVEIPMEEKEILEQPLKAADMAWDVIKRKKLDEIIMDILLPKETSYNI